MRSQLCVFDLESGTTGVLLDHDDHIEAPNWHPDGYLIVNGAGRLFRVPLAAPALIPIDTGFARACNNDHGISPDGETLAYVGGRGGPFALLTCLVTGGTETCVTDAFDHVDGPDYTPDGQWIWFNGERQARVDLWRIRPGGTDLQRMTDDAAVNWFPHPSPDGAHVLYLGYPDGTKGHLAGWMFRCA